MTTNPIFQFKTLTDTGIDLVPVGAKVYVDDSDGLGTSKEITKTGVGTLISTSTIQDFLNDTGIWKETPPTINGGVY